MSDHEDSQNPSIHSYGSSARSQTSSPQSYSSFERPTASPQKKPVDASTCAPSSSAAQVVSGARSVDEGFTLLDDRLLLEQPSYMQKAQVHELRNLMPDGYQLFYRATWKNIISLHAGTTIGIHYHSIKDLGEFSIHPFKVLFFETYGIMPGQLALNGHRMLNSFINVCRFLRIPLSLRLFNHMFDVRPGSKETLGFMIVSSHQGRAFLSGLPPSNRGWKDKYVSIKFPPDAFSFSQNAWGKRMKVQVKPRETDDLAAWEAALRIWDTSTRGLYNVGKWGVYLGLETNPKHEIVLGEAIPDAIPLRRVQGSKAPVSAVAGSSCRGKKKEKGPPYLSSILFCFVGRIGQEWFTRLVKSKDEEKARLEGMMVACRKEAKATHEKAEKTEEKLPEHYVAFCKLYAKHEGLLKASKEVDAQAQEKIQELEGEKAKLQKEAARSAQEVA
ncbi:unnamed protein product [Cuscuta campestris]|uniref:Uncharacterized protein n=1 Tax=Cuscuta campestris TaxID=132261 RepID=A0A484K4X9_9ASTE|nr:unnamed protein product [Cuscuta campestris]